MEEWARRLLAEDVLMGRSVLVVCRSALGCWRVFRDLRRLVPDEMVERSVGSWGRWELRFVNGAKVRVVPWRVDGRVDGRAVRGLSADRAFCFVSPFAAEELLRRATITSDLRDRWIVWV